MAVANLDKKKKAVKPAQSEQRARLAKIAENKKINEEKARVKTEAKSETAPLAQEEAIVSKPEVIAPKSFDARASSYSASMDCVRNNLKKKDDGRSNIRAVAYELAVLCRQKGVQVDSIANGTVPLVEQNRARKR